jgi:hypothetical protein
MSLNNAILFHGSTLVVEKPLVDYGRPELDFGPGFYLTHDREQAERWAQTKAGRMRDGQAILNIYRFDEKAFSEQLAYQRLVFADYNQEWLDFIAASRKGRAPWQDLDWIEGGVANDSVISTVDAYVDGFISAEQAIGQLINERLRHQVCIRHQSIIEHFLTFEQANIL